MYNNVDAVFGGSAKLLSLVELIYGAVDDNSLWNVVLEQTADVVHAQGTVLFSDYSGTDIQNIAASARIEPAALRSYTDYYEAKNVLISQGDRVFRDGEPRFSHQAVLDCELDATEYYSDWLVPTDVYYGLGIKIRLENHAPALLSSLRPKRSGPFEERDGNAFATLLPHLQRALVLHHQLNGLRASVNGLEFALDSFEFAVVGLDSRGAVALVNQAAEAIMQDGDGIKLFRGQLIAEGAKQNAELQSQIADAVTPHALSSHPREGALLIRRKSARPSLQVTITSVPSTLTSLYCQLAALVFIADPASVPPLRSNALRMLYGLSPIECRLANLLAAGNDIADSSDALGLKATAARSHLKSIFRKTGTNRQTELVRRVLGIPGTL